MLLGLLVARAGDLQRDLVQTVIMRITALLESQGIRFQFGYSVGLFGHFAGVGCLGRFRFGIDSMGIDG